jgi:hypothetical protein
MRALIVALIALVSVNAYALEPTGKRLRLIAGTSAPGDCGTGKYCVWFDSATSRFTVRLSGSNMGWFGYGYLNSGFGIGGDSVNYLDFGGAASGANAIRIVAGSSSALVIKSASVAPYTAAGIDLGEPSTPFRLVMVGAASGSKPTCDATYRGALFVQQSGAGAGDIVQGCLKGTADTYAWRNIYTAP